MPVVNILRLKSKLKILNSYAIFKSGSIALFFKLGAVLLNYLLIYILAKLYGAQGVGAFSTCWTILSISIVLGKFGFDTSIVKFIAGTINTESSYQISDYYRKSIFIVFLSSTMIGLTLFLLSPKIHALFFRWNSLIDVLHIQLIALTTIPFSLLSINSETFRGMKRITLFSLYQNGSVYFLAIIFILFLNLFYHNLLIVFVSLILAIIILMIISSIGIGVLTKTFRENAKIQLNPLKVKNKSIINVSFPMMLSNSLFLIMNWTDIIMLSFFKTSASVGIYSTALKIAALNSLILFAVNSIAMPKYAELYHNGKQKEFKKTIKQASLIISLASLPILLTILIFPKFLLGIFGNEFLPGASTLIILSIGQFVNAFSGSTIPIMNMTGQEKTGRNILIVGAIVNISLNYFLIPVLGINGAAFATTISTILWNTFAVLFIYKKHKFLTYPI